MEVGAMKVTSQRPRISGRRVSKQNHHEIPLTPVRIAILKRLEIKSIGGVVVKREHLCTITS